MNFTRFLLFGFLLTSYFQVFSQKIISGTVIDSLTSKPLPYVSIEIENKNIGTVTDKNGNFNITIAEAYVNDTLTFSMIGYQDSKSPIALFNSNDQLIKLVETATVLSMFEISAERLVERKFGVWRRNLFIHFSDGMFQGDDQFEIGQCIKLKGTKAKITSVNLYLFDAGRDSITFRINFYKLEEGIPTKRLIDESIVQRHPIEQGWLRLNIHDKNIVIEDDFVVSLEFIPTESEAKTKVYYEIKLGGSSRSYYRKNGLNGWNTPPHHYCMYVTALVDKSSPEEPEEMETLPFTSLWSEQVKDSFNLFLRLPRDYEKKKSQSFPVIYCLDANAYFDHICHIIDELSKKKVLNTEPIIVGIGYKNAYLMDSLRVRDYTFPEAPPSDSLPISGGGKRFYDFIKTELLQYVDKNYRTDSTNRTIMGHSFGAYFVCFALLNDLIGTATFNNYVAACPSLWFSNSYITEQFNSLSLPVKNSTHARIFLTIGEAELQNGDEGNFESFQKSIAKLQAVNIDSKVYPYLDHMGAAIPSFEEAIRKIVGNVKRIK